MTVDQEGPACHTGDRTCFDADVLLPNSPGSPRTVAERARSRTFGPVVLAGLAGAGLAAVAGHEPWAHASRSGRAAGPSPSRRSRPPAAGAVRARSCLACWGVLLVTRGLVRRVASVLAALLSPSDRWSAVVTGVRRRKGRTVTTGVADLGGTCAVDLTGWYWVAVVALPFAVVPAVAAVFLVPTWPEMGRRYDAPAGAPTAPAAAPEEQENLDLWKAMDEGRDPTA